MSVASARTAATGAKVKVDGVVAKIAYASGIVPCGVYLVDETQSIYVYDGDLAGRVKVGNKITIAATKAYWILEKEQANAAKFGYNSSYLSRSFSKTFGISFNKYLTMLRLREAILLMRSGEMNVTECALESGFGSMRSFYRAFREEFGCTPKEYFDKEQNK